MKRLQYEKPNHPDCAEASVHRRVITGELSHQRTTHLYRVWHHMIDAALNPNDKSYIGARGVDARNTVSPSWTIFAYFIAWALNDGHYQEGYSLSRKDLTVGFYPDNCVFVPPSHKNGSKSILHHVEAWGGDFTGVEIATRLGMSKQNFHTLNVTRGIPVEDIVSGAYLRNKNCKRRGGKQVRRQRAMLAARADNEVTRFAVKYPTPWRVDSATHCIVDAEGERIADMYHGSVSYDVAKHICTAVNRYVMTNIGSGMNHPETEANGKD